MSRDLFDRYFDAAFNDIYVIDECYSCVFMISNNAKAINDAGIGHFFGRVQEHLREMMVVGIGRVFDVRCDVYSIPNMVANSQKFPLNYKNTFLNGLQSLGVDADLVSVIEKEGLSSGAVAGLCKIVPTARTCPKLRRVINMRHKEVAHRDNTATKFDRPIFKDVLDCAVLAKDWIACFSDGIRGGHFRDADGTIPVFDDALSASRQMRRIFQLCYAIPTDDDFELSYVIERNKRKLRERQSQK